MRLLRLACLFPALLSSLAIAQSVQGPRAVYFDKINVCPDGQVSPKPCSLTRKLIYTVTADATFGKTKVVTQGTPNLDFKLSGTTCKGTLAAGATVHRDGDVCPSGAGCPHGGSGAYRLFWKSADSYSNQR